MEPIVKWLVKRQEEMARWYSFSTVKDRAMSISLNLKKYGVELFGANKIQKQKPENMPLFHSTMKDKTDGGLPWKGSSSGTPSKAHRQSWDQASCDQREGPQSPLISQITSPMQYRNSKTKMEHLLISKLKITTLISCLFKGTDHKWSSTIITRLSNVTQTHISQECLKDTDQIKKDAMMWVIEMKIIPKWCNIEH